MLENGKRRPDEGIFIRARLLSHSIPVAGAIISQFSQRAHDLSTLHNTHARNDMCGYMCDGVWLWGDPCALAACGSKNVRALFVSSHE